MLHLVVNFEIWLLAHMAALTLISALVVLGVSLITTIAVHGKEKGETQKSGVRLSVFRGSLWENRKIENSKNGNSFFFQSMTYIVNEF